MEPEYALPRPRMAATALMIQFGLVLCSAAAADSGGSCGYMFTQVLHFCGQPDLSEPSACCVALRRFNDALCWCQPTALAAAAMLATNQYAFALRAEYCQIANPLRPAFPARDGPPTKDTCPPEFVSLAPEDGVIEDCAAPVKLRGRREAALSALDALTLASTTEKDVTSFKEEVSRWLTEHTAFSSAGLFATFGVSRATDFLLSRQVALGSAVAWAPKGVTTTVRGKFWRKADMVSYSIDFSSPDGSRVSRLMFVGFEPCSEKMLEVYVVEADVIRSIAIQFYYPALPVDAISQYNVSVEQICTRIAKGCAALSPYASKTECEKHMTELKKEKKVMCNKFDKQRVTVFALFGDTIACKYSYALAAEAESQRYCPFVGPEGKGHCDPSLCAADEYEDIFTAPNPRYTQSSSFTCNTQTGVCVENWPQKAV